LRDDIIVSTRSRLEAMFYLSQAVDVPLPHQAKGLVTLTVDAEGNAFDWSKTMHDLFTIRHCDKSLKHADVAVKY
jgi:hypothetical protein